MVYLYYLKSLKPILLNPYYKSKEIGNLDSEEPVTIFSANTLSKDDLDYIERECFYEIDNSVNLWIQEKRYYPRLFISAIAFFIMYFFLSLVIRDPIPVVDEILGSIAFAVFSWWFFSKNDSKSAIAKKKKLEIKRQVSNAKYEELSLLNKIEEYIFDLKTRDILDIADALTLVEGELDLIKINSNESILADNIFFLLKNKVLLNADKTALLYKKVQKVNESGIKNEALSSKLIDLGKEDKNSLLTIVLLHILDKSRAI